MTTPVWNISMWAGIRTDHLERIINCHQYIPVWISAEPDNRVDHDALVVLSDLPEWIVGSAKVFELPSTFSPDRCRLFHRIGYVSRAQADKDKLHRFVSERGVVDASLYLIRQINTQEWQLFCDIENSASPF